MSAEAISDPGSVTTYHHGDCYDADDPAASEIEIVPREGGGWSWVCKNCGTPVGYTMDFGTLDLWGEPA